MRRFLLALFAVTVALVGYAFAQARSDPVIRRATLSLPGWQRGEPPVRVALLGDIHIGGPAMDEGRLRRIVGQVNALRPDLVLIAGDFISGHDPVAGARAAAQLGAPLSGLRARYGVVAVLGNHDHWTAPELIHTQLESAGIVVLENEVARRGPLTIGGVDDPFTERDRMADVLARMTSPGLILAHSPDIAPETPHNTLVLAGHTHCGQVVLPFVGPLVQTSPVLGRRLYDPRYRCGIIRDGARVVVVTGGLGASFPFRLGAPPDIWLLTLGK